MHPPSMYEAHTPIELIPEGLQFATLALKGLYTAMTPETPNNPTSVEAVHVLHCLLNPSKQISACG